VRGAVLQICINRPAKRNGFMPKAITLARA
jgi:1,4-dihydroxy-2-naphthoyl-CoA synthase